MQLEAGNTTYAVSEGVLFSADMTKILSYPANRTADSFTIPKEVTEIGAYTFSEITSLKTVTFEEGGVEALVIGKAAFYKCTGIEFIVLPERTTVIGDYAFNGCSGLMSVVLPSTLEEIGYDAFYYCSKLLQVGNFSELEINFENAPGEIDYAMIYYYDAEGGHMYDIENSDYYDIIVVDYPGWGNVISVTDDGYVTFKYSDDRTFVIGYKGEATEIVIPETITDIYEYAFYNSNVTNVTISDNVQIIWEYAFRECDALTNVTLNGNLIYVLEYAFYRNANLAVVNIPTGIYYMDYSVFSGCYNAILFVEETSRPSVWASTFYSSASLVIWGYTGADQTYSFVTNCDTVIESITTSGTITLPEISREGYVFTGWYTNAELTGGTVSGVYYSQIGDVTFYAGWMTQEEWDYLASLGKSFDDARPALPGSFDVNIENGGDKYYFIVTTGDTAQTITFATGDGKDTVVYLYDSNREQLKKQDNGYAETFTYTFEANTTYYVAVAFYSSYNTGSFPVTVS